VPLDPHCRRVLALIAGGGASVQDLATRRRSLDDLGRMAGDAGAEGVSTENLMLPTPVGALAIRTYRPDTIAHPSPAILYLHGGGWTAGSLDTHDGACRALAASSGFKVFSVDYRLAPEHPFPAAIDDALHALHWLRGRAVDLGIDAGRLVIAGDSAGANIAVAATAAAVAQGLRIARQLLLCPILDPGRTDGSRALFAQGYFIESAIFQSDLAAYLGPQDLDDPRICAPRIADLSALPPAHIHVAEYDPFRDEGLAYADQLNASGRRADAIVHAGMIHYFYALPRLIPYARQALAAIGHALAEDLSRA
jgi:acetyl esterase/lipase